ncbi:hypothetical protein C8J98_103247 [Luteibacter sp. OK325]|nr:hypothetical protein C8J98_103247 [Luteibacter sp. OK325]
MKAICWIIGCSVIAVIIWLCGPLRSEGGGHDDVIADAISRTTKLVDGKPRVYDPSPQQRTELTYALSVPPGDGGARAMRSRDIRCYHNCPPPVGSVTASPQVVSVPVGTLGDANIHWRWDQSSTQPVTQHSCLWVSSGEESEAHLVDCGTPGHTHQTSVRWIGRGNYVFRVAPGNPEGPFTKPVAGLFQLAQTIVVGAPW